jgi:hypothetical protein
MGLGMGASVLVSRYWGMKKAADGHEEEAGHALKQTVCLMLRITVGLAALFALATLLMPSLLMKMYTSDEEIIRLGDIYFRWSIITYFFLGTSLVSTIVLRSVGQVRLPLYVSIGAFFVNLGANYAFIFGKFGAPRMEVAGAALGTLIARLFDDFDQSCNHVITGLVVCQTGIIFDCDCIGSFIISQNDAVAVIDGSSGTGRFYIFLDTVCKCIQVFFTVDDLETIESQQKYAAKERKENTENEDHQRAQHFETERDHRIFEGFPESVGIRSGIINHLPCPFTDRVTALLNLLRRWGCYLQ